MANLLDTIRNNQGLLASQSAPMTDQTQKVQSLLAARSGRTIDQTAPISNLSEQSANDQTSQQLRGVGQQINIQKQQAAQSNAAEDTNQQLAQAQVDQSKKFLTVQNSIKTNQLLSDLSRDRASLSLDKDKARLEQTSFLLAMQDKSYTDQLQDIGKKRRLDDEANFHRAMEETALGGQLDILNSKLEGQDIMAVNDRQFKNALSNMSVDDAQQMASTEIQTMVAQGVMSQDTLKYVSKQQATAANAQAQAQGMAGILTGGLGAAGAIMNSSSKSTPSAAPNSSNSNTGYNTDYSSSNSTGNIA